MRFSPAGREYYNREVDLNSLFTADNCNSDIFKSIRKEWAGAIGCHFYVDGKKKTKDEEFNAYTIYYDFSKFNNDTVIHYDILAGENYRSEPLSSAQKTAVVSDDN
ncbi:Uncharacterised protein [Vibrio cholerae]|nr:Uncharacterised protein [Vibrio cholerae]